MIAMSTIEIFFLLEKQTTGKAEEMVVKTCRLKQWWLVKLKQDSKQAFHV